MCGYGCVPVHHARLAERLADAFFLAFWAHMKDDREVAFPACNAAAALGVKLGQRRARIHLGVARFGGKRHSGKEVKPPIRVRVRVREGLGLGLGRTWI